MDARRSAAVSCLSSCQPPTHPASAAVRGKGMDGWMDRRSIDDGVDFVFDCWLLAAGCWLLAVLCWWWAVCCLMDTVVDLRRCLVCCLEGWCVGVLVCWCVGVLVACYCSRHRLVVAS